MRIRKAVIPAAGLGTRFLPATKVIPKEMLPVVDKPAIEMVVSEAFAAGLEDVLVITARGKEAIADHFDSAPELEAALAAKNDTQRLALVQASDLAGKVHFVRQAVPRGLGDAIAHARPHVGDEHFAVLLGDDIVDERDPILPAMLDLAQRTGGSVVLLLEVPEQMVSLYGSAAVVPLPQESGTTLAPAGDQYRISWLVEKPKVADAPSRFAVIGRYVLSPAIFDVIAATPPGVGGEVQITDAISTLAGMGADFGGGVYGLVMRGRRYDTGDKLDYLKAVVRLGSERSDFGPAFKEWLRDFVAGGDVK